MSFRADDLHNLEHAHEVRIETHADQKTTHSTVIWIVVDQGQVFARSVRGVRGRWYREALANSAVTIDDEGRRLESVAVPVHDADSIRRVSESLERKYGEGADGLASMLEPDVLDATLRLDPRVDNEAALEAPAYLGSDEPSELGPPVEVGPLDGGPAIDESVLLQPHKSV